MLIKPLLHYIFHFLTWRDFIEITFFSCCFIKLINWLSRDRNTVLLRSFYCYGSLIFVSYICDLTTISYALFIAFPATIVIFTIFHQESLQRNFVTYKNQQLVPNTLNSVWIELLIQRCLVALNQRQSIRIVFEHTSNLDSFLTSAHIINIPISRASLDLLLTSPLYLAHHMIWIKPQGLMYGYNCIWQFSQESQEKSYQTEEWYFQTLWYTTKTDALILEVNHQTYSFSVFVGGKQMNELTIHQAHEYIARYLELSSLGKGVTNGSTSTQSFKEKNP